jgi:hypothetical protein
MPERDSLRPSPEKIKEGLRGVFDAVKREDAGETDALGKFLDEQEKKLKAERAEQGLNAARGEESLETDSKRGSKVRRSMTAAEIRELVIDPLVELWQKAGKKYGEGIYPVAWKLWSSDMSDEEFWDKLKEYWDGLDEDARKRCREMKLDPSCLDDLWR